MSRQAGLVITGASGFVGRNLMCAFGSGAGAGGGVAGVDVNATPGVTALDLRDEAATVSTIGGLGPVGVIHVAGIKDVRRCEQDPLLAHEINAVATANVARACRDAGCAMIYLSTDLVFDCAVGGYREDDVPRPAIEYGKSKLEGERLARAILPGVAICRSGGIYGKNSPLLKWLAGELAAGKRVPCFTDVYNTPTFADNLAEMMQAILDGKLSGIFHTVGRERVNRFEFFRHFAEAFDLPAVLLDPIAGGEKRDQMLLQADSSLSSEKSAAMLGMRFNSVAEGFARLRESGGLT